MAKQTPIHVCPACGGTDTQKVEWSGQIGRDGEDDYNGWWVECLACGLQGPKLVWDRMAKRRADIQRALGVSEAIVPQHQRYVLTIEGFGHKMFRELAANDEKKGDFLAWKPNDAQAVSEVEHHTVKLVAAIHRRKKQEITEFCADLANTAMGIDATLGAK